MKLSPVSMLAGGGLALLAATPALAHTGHGADHGLLAGLTHPLLGLDHLLAMMAIGLWAAQQRGRQRLALPLAFLLALAVGFLLGLSALPLPLVESGIAVSVLILGLLVTTAARLPTYAGLALTALFALFHGHAHGSEFVAGSVTAFAGGFLLASLLLQLAGGALQRLLRHQAPVAIRLVGMALSVTGAGLLTVA